MLSKWCLVDTIAAMDRLPDLLARAARLIAADGHDGDLNPVQWQALRYLAAANRFSRTPGALAAWLGQTKGTVSQTLIALERKGLVARARDETDRRVVRLVLTATGEERLDGAPESIAAQMVAHLGGFDRAVLERVLQHMLAGHLAAHGNRPFGLCRDCRHFRAGRGTGGGHHCALLDVPLDDRDAAAVCVEQEAA